MGNLYETKNKTDRKYTNSQLQQDQTYFYHYDVESNLIFKEHIKDVGFRPFFSGSELRDLGINPKSTGKGFLYTWNANGSLRSVTDLKGVTYRFRYDAFGRRLEKRRMASTFRFVWDGNVLLHETFKKDNSENTELTTWVFEGFVPTAKLVSGKAYSIISDHLGTPILAIDSEGNEVWNRQLDIYGRVRHEFVHPSLGDEVFPFVPFLYQGQYYDFETGLCYNRFRYYSPETGAYISQDPIRLAGNNPNIYAYVFDSNIQVDVFGLDLKPENGYLRGKKHGIKVTDKDAQIYANKEGISYGKWGSKKDLEIAGSLAETLEVGVFQDFPVNADSKSVVFHSGGSIDEIVQYPATHYRLRNNGNGTFHGFPIDETAEPIRTGNTNLNTNSH